MTQPPKRKADSLLDTVDGPILTIVVGQQKFQAPWKVLAHHSSYFRGLMNSNFEEGLTNTVKLEDVEENVFRRFLGWVYYGKICEERTAPEEARSENFRAHPWTYCGQLDLCKIWVFGDMRGIPGLQNAAIKELKRDLDVSDSVQHDAIHYLCRNTAADAKVRAFMVHFIATRSDWQTIVNSDPWKKNIYENWTMELMLAIIARIDVLRTQGDRPLSLAEWRYDGVSSFFV